MMKCWLMLLIVLISGLCGCQKSDPGNNKTNTPSAIEQDDIDIPGSYRSLDFVEIAVQELPDKTIKFRFSIPAEPQTAELCGAAKLSGDSVTFKNDRCEIR